MTDTARSGPVGHPAGLPASLAMIGAIRAYKLFVSPLLGLNCRFLPGCSDYALEAIRTHGPATGGWLAAKRLCRCHPWGGDGYDPVPPLPSRRPIADPR